MEDVAIKWNADSTLSNESSIVTILKVKRTPDWMKRSIRNWTEKELSTKVTSPQKVKEAERNGSLSVGETKVLCKEHGCCSVERTKRNQDANISSSFFHWDIKLTKELVATGVCAETAIRGGIWVAEISSYCVDIRLSPCWTSLACRWLENGQLRVGAVNR